jgi:hypothetical protein
MNRALGIVLLVGVALLAGAVVHDPVSGGPERSAATPDTPQAVQTNAVGAQEFDYTEFRIEVLPNGSARWTFHFERRLTNDSEEERFRAFAENFEENDTRLFTDFRRQARALATEGENATGRSMEATAFSRRAEVDEELGTDTIGVVEMSFIWTEFAEDDGDRIVVGDVFEAGLYIGPEQALVVQRTDDLTFESAIPGGEPSAGSLSESDSVTWRGERRFTDNRPRVVLVPSDAAETASEPGTTTNGSALNDDGPSDGGDDTGMSSSLTLIAALAVLLVGTVAVVALRRSDSVFGGDASEAGGSGGDDTGAASGTGAADPAIEDEELLSDEDRVVNLLSENDGRLTQVEIVEETDWSKSKVSMLLSDMEEEGTISKLRVGRENIISLDGDEPEAAGSPFDEE